MTTTINTRHRWIPPGSAPVTRDNIDAIVYVNGLVAVAYKGKSTKHAWNYIFRTAQHMNEEIDRFFAGVKSHQDRIMARKEERKNFKTCLVPGDIMVTHWGYEQTNRGFFQVITVKGNTVSLREIEQNVTENGFMAGYTSPVKDSFLPDAPVLTRRVIPGLKQGDRHDSVRIDDIRDAWIADRDQYYVSWYG